MTEKVARWATLYKDEIISAQERELGTRRPDVAPHINDPKVRRLYSAVKVPLGVKAGMVRGGKREAVAGFGFRD